MNPGSEARNPLIAAVLHETAFAETKGSGIRVMRRLLKEANLAPPTFESDRAQDEFVATFFLHNLLDDEDLAWLANFADLNLSTDEAKALVHVREAGQITNAAYRDLNGVDTLEASGHLRRLRDLKLLEQHDRGAATFYTPTDRFRNPGLKPAVDTSAGKASARGDRHSGMRQVQPDNFGEQSDKLNPQSDNLSEESGNQELPKELAEAVAQLNRWTPQPDLRYLIQRLCAWRPMTSGELATTLKRSRTYLRTSYIGPMIQDGELIYTNPAKPNDPGQKYRSGIVNR